MDKLKEIMELVSKFAKALITYESVLDIQISEIDGDSLDRALYDVKRTHDALESALRALLERKPLSEYQCDALSRSVFGWSDRSATVLIKTTEAFLAGKISEIPEAGTAIFALEESGVEIKPRQIVME